MKTSDLITTCLHNLFRHKSRTVLTVLGVVVGCCSVVLMISFGIAMRISTNAMLDELGDLSIIQVTAKGKSKLNEKSVEKMKHIDGVLAVTPKISESDVEFTIQTEDGRYVCEGPSMVGMDTKNLEDLGYNLDKGDYLSPSDKNTMLFGHEMAYQFKDTMRPEGSNTIDYWSFDTGEGSTPPTPYFDPMNTKLKLVVGSTYSNANDKKVTVDLGVKGVLKEDMSKYETSWGCIIDIEQMQNLIAEYNSLNNISGQSKSNYEEVVVKVSDLSLVNQVEKEIKNLGFSTYSMESVREPYEKEAKQKELMFAGLGVISLFVAALGITNTMIMSITERTREIGVMKALGCFIKDIRAIFLLEAGCIGFMGGIIGSLMSIVISCIINLVSLKDQLADGFTWDIIKTVLFESTERVSVVPWELVLGSIVFSIFVGVASGYYPANKAATKISAIEAIKAE